LQPSVLRQAAINVRKPILEHTSAEFDKVVGVDLRGNFNVLMAVRRITGTGPSADLGTTRLCH
jgi:hypothetical protein